MAIYSTNMGVALSEGGTDIDKVIRRGMMRSAAPATLYRGVVIDVITDPDLLTNDQIVRLGTLVDNSELVPLMTPNTIVAKIISSNQSDSTWTSVIFPFWSSHIMTPIAPGEQVYIIYEDIATTGKKVGFWLTRVHAYNTIEDANYTHFDRRFDPTINRFNYTTSESLNRPTATSPETFQNGGNTAASVTLPIGSDATQNPYDIIFEEADASTYITPEPVPRWKKRPQELILQGANNTLIMLGEDRNGPISGAIQATPVDITTTNGLPRQAGAIDIVAGRGRYFLGAGEDPRGGSATTNPAGQNSTAPLIVENTRGFKETDKNPYRTSREGISNPFEGDPSPIYDAARIYVVQQSRVDENYLLVPSVSGLDYPDGAIPNEQPPENGEIGRSYVVAKADHLRLIARREPQLDTGSENIAGTILIVREGAKNTGSPTDGVDPDSEPDGNLAYIYFNKEGKIQIDANRIYLGQATGEAQPYIRYAAYENTIQKLQGEIDDLRQFVKNFHDTVKNGFQSASTTPSAPYSPITSLTPSYIQLQSQTVPSAPDVETVKAKSKKVFGE
jgi:hypothetical protein